MGVQRPSAAKAVVNQLLIAAVNRCATQRQVLKFRFGWLGVNMENWKRAVIAGSAGVAMMLLVRRRRPAAVLVGGVGLAVLASEYPEKFEKIREDLPSYVRQGTRLLETAMKFGSKIEELAEKRAARAFEELGEF